MNAYEIINTVIVNNERLKECDSALEDIEELNHILFRLQNNSIIKELSKTSHMLTEAELITDIWGAVFRKKAEIQVENSACIWHVRQECEAKPRGRPRKEGRE